MRLLTVRCIGFFDSPSSSRRVFGIGANQHHFGHGQRCVGRRAARCHR